ncbi:MAG: hypothetical protein H6566_15950 [Lewinellaceae bacterium]|nr:hypothetical protein [Lewinellaceae bacterium]
MKEKSGKNPGVGGSTPPRTTMNKWHGVAQLVEKNPGVGIPLFERKMAWGSSVGKNPGKILVSAVRLRPVPLLFKQLLCSPRSIIITIIWLCSLGQMVIP